MMTTAKRGTGSLTYAAKFQSSELAAPRLLNLLPLLEDEGDVPLRARALQPTPLEMEVDAWSWYRAEYEAIIAQALAEPILVFTVFVDGLQVGEETELPMLPDPDAMFPVRLNATLPLTHKTFDIQFEYYIRRFGNEVPSEIASVRYDRIEPNEKEPFTLSGPGLIDRPHLDANGGYARFEVPRWADIKLEDQALVYFQPFDDVDLPAQPTQIITITPANKDQQPVVLLIEESNLVEGRYRVTCHLTDRSGNINRLCNTLDVTVSLSSPALLDPVEAIPPYASIFGWINCASLDQVSKDYRENPLTAGLRFLVPQPEDGDLPAGPLQLTWQVCWDKFGEDPVGAVSYLPGTPVELPQNRILLMPRINELVVGQMEGAVRLKQQRLDELREQGEWTDEELMRNAGKLGIPVKKLKELLKSTGDAKLPMEGSVRVAYRIQEKSGRWVYAKPEVYWVSLQLPGTATCIGPWPI